jgi:hypothetical protein
MFEMGDIHFPNGAMFTDMRVELPSGPREPLPPPGVSRTVSIDDALWYLRYHDAAGTVTPLALPASIVLRVTGAPPGADRFFDVEIIALSLNGLPPGEPLLRIRESPTLPSTGVMRLTETDGGFMASSFFDVFTELSLDGGQMWSTATNASHAELRPQAPLAAVPTNFFPPRDHAFGQLRNAPPLKFAGLPPMLRNLQHVGFEDNAPLVETPGAAQVLDLPHTATFELSTDGGQTWKKGARR